MKTILRKTLPLHLLSFEELNTILTQVEAILNSRPLLPLDTTPPDGSLVLTPGHFLTGRALKALPLKTNSDFDPSLLKRWKLVQHLNQHIWHLWSTSYLRTLQARSKWKKSHPNFMVGEVVIIKDETLRKENVQINPWPLGLVTEVHPGLDGLVRVVTVCCQEKTFTRPINRLVKLFSGVADNNTSPALPRVDVQAS